MMVVQWLDDEHTLPGWYWYWNNPDPFACVVHGPYKLEAIAWKNVLYASGLLIPAREFT